MLARNATSWLAPSNDNRELIPEFFNEIEILLNLNCVDFGIKNSKLTNS